jgi:hypothetical protein
MTSSSFESSKRHCDIGSVGILRFAQNDTKNKRLELKPKLKPHPNSGQTQAQIQAQTQTQTVGERCTRHPAGVGARGSEAEAKSAETADPSLRSGGQQEFVIGNL